MARLALKLAQETLDFQQNKLDQGQATLGDVEQARLDESEKWVEFLDADFEAMGSKRTPPVTGARSI